MNKPANTDADTETAILYHWPMPSSDDPWHQVTDSPFRTCRRCGETLKFTEDTWVSADWHTAECPAGKDT